MPVTVGTSGNREADNSGCICGDSATGKDGDGADNTGKIGSYDDPFFAPCKCLVKTPFYQMELLDGLKNEWKCVNSNEKTIRIYWIITNNTLEIKTILFYFQ